MEGERRKDDEAAGQGLATARLAVLLALGSFSGLCLGGLGVLPAAAGWILALWAAGKAGGGEAGAPVRQAARMAVLLAVLSTLLNGLLLLLSIVRLVNTHGG
jgi:hypothetical protein